MTIEEILRLIRAVKQNRWNPAEEAVLCGIWEGKTYQDIARESHYNPKYLKNAGSQLWKFLSDLFKKTINKRNCRSILSQCTLTEQQRQLIKNFNCCLPPTIENQVVPEPYPSSLKFPSRPVPIDSTLYIERPPIEASAYQEIRKLGALVRIKAPRQMGKTSLMLRILAAARAQGYRTVALSFEQADRQLFDNLDNFLRWLCTRFTRKLHLPYRVDEYWSDIYGSKSNCTAYFEDYLLSETDAPLVIALDQVDEVFPHPEIADDFFSLLRCWYEAASYGDSGSQVWEKLRLIVVHSTEVYIPLDTNKSPFNVGLAIELQPFTQEQVEELAQRHQLELLQNHLTQLIQLVAGHPYLVNVAFHHLAQQDISLEQLMETAATDGGIYRDHLHRHLRNLQQHPQLAAAFDRVVRASAPVELEQVLAFKLHGMGLVSLQGNEVTTSCELYRRYFSDRLS